MSIAPAGGLAATIYVGPTYRQYPGREELRALLLAAMRVGAPLVGDRPLRRLHARLGLREPAQDIPGPPGRYACG